MNNCPHCDEEFENSKQVKDHIRKNTSSCQKIRNILAKKEASIKAEYEQRINIIQEKNKKVVDAIVNVPASVKDRQRELENVEGQGKIANFERVMHCTKIPQEVLRDTVELMADGDVILFKRVFIEHTEPDLRCVRVKDFARDKYEIYDGTAWVTTTLDHIVRVFAEDLHKKYRFLIDEKYKKVREIDLLFPPKYERFYKINAEKVDELSIEYANITEHITKLGVHDAEFLGQIKRGIKGVLSNPNKGITLEKKSEKFVYDEKTPDSEEAESLDEEDYNSDSGSDTDAKKLGEVLIPILKIIGIRTEYDY
jgi:hypothetical protein